MEDRGEQQLGHGEQRVRCRRGRWPRRSWRRATRPGRRRCRSGGTAACRRPRGRRSMASQWSVCQDGSPTLWGISLNDTALAPLAATRSTSLVEQLDVPVGEDGQRDLPVGVGGAPLVDGEVVPGLHARVGQLLVLHARRTCEPAKPGSEGKQSWAWIPSAVHVLDPLVDVVATGAHLVEAHRVEADLLLGLAGDGVEADRRVPDAVDLPHLLVALVDVAQRVGGGSLDVDDPRAPIAELGGEPVLEGVAMLDHVVVDRADLDISGQRHGSPSDAGLDASVSRVAPDECVKSVSAVADSRSGRSEGGGRA